MCNKVATSIKTVNAQLELKTNKRWKKMINEGAKVRWIYSRVTFSDFCLRLTLKQIHSII